MDVFAHGRRQRVARGGGRTVSARRGRSRAPVRMVSGACGVTKHFNYLRRWVEDQIRYLFLAVKPNTFSAALSAVEAHRTYWRRWRKRRAAARGQARRRATISAVRWAATDAGRHTEFQTTGQPIAQIHPHADRQIGIQAGRQPTSQANIQIDRQSGGQPDRQTDIQTDMQTYRRTDMQT